MSKSRDLPIGAIPCEMLYTDGYGTFIDTNIIPSSFMSYEADVCWIKPSSNYSSFFGYNIDYVRFAMHKNSAGRLEIGYGNAIAGTYPSINLIYQKSRHRVSVTPSGAHIDTYDWGGGELVNSQDIVYFQSPNFTHTLGLLGRKQADSSIDSGNFRGGLGRFKLYDDANFGNLIADLIPCYYNSNFGYWERVSKVFLVGNNPSKIYGFGEFWGSSGWTPNVRNSSNSGQFYFEDFRGLITGTMLEIPSNCSSIQFNAGINNYGSMHLMFFDSNKAYVDYFSYTEPDRVVNVPSNAKYVRLSMSNNEKDSCYIYDVSNSAYIWKGNNVN